MCIWFQILLDTQIQTTITFMQLKVFYFQHLILFLIFWQTSCRNVMQNNISMSKYANLKFQYMYYKLEPINILLRLSFVFLIKCGRNFARMIDILNTRLWFNQWVGHIMTNVYFLFAFNPLVSFFPHYVQTPFVDNE